MSTNGPPAVYNGRYELERLVARGGMAEVYLARDLLLDRPVALKVLFPEFSVDRTFVARFRREAQAAANLSHPNIVPIYDWGEAERTYFIVMEYVDGRPLSALLRSGGPMPAEQAAAVGVEVAAALAYAHRQGVVHRDVKPGNVLISGEGDVKVADFGIARAKADESLTQTGAVMGTATYFSPEQAQGEVIDARSDVYSLGVVLFEAVCGAPPFSGENPLAIAYKHVRQEPPRFAEQGAQVPADFEAIVFHALEKDPDQRYQSAVELRADLLRFQYGKAISAPDLPAFATGAPATGAPATGAAGAGEGQAEELGPRPPAWEPGLRPPTWRLASSLRAGEGAGLRPGTPGGPGRRRAKVSPPGRPHRLESRPAAAVRPPANRPPANRPPANRPPANRPPANRPPANRPPAGLLLAGLPQGRPSPLGAREPAWPPGSPLPPRPPRPPGPPLPPAPRPGLLGPIPNAVPGPSTSVLEPRQPPVQGAGPAPDPTRANPRLRVQPGYDDFEGAPRPSRTWVWGILLVVLLIVLAVVVYFIAHSTGILNRHNTPPTTTTVPAPLVNVPNEVNQQYTAAVADLSAKGFHNVTESPMQESQPAGTVTAQSITGQAAQSAPIVLTVSSGPASTQVPDLHGDNEAQAGVTLQQDQLALGTITQQASSSVPVGQIISTTPSANTPEPVGTKVNLVVSSGEPMSVLPDVVGLPVSVAEMQLTQLGFSVAPLTYQPVVLPNQDGNVVLQDPEPTAPGQMVLKGGTVNLTVGKLIGSTSTTLASPSPFPTTTLPATTTTVGATTTTSIPSPTPTSG